MTQEEIIKFNSVKEFINWLIYNEGKILADMYGRQWKYERYGFKFKDIVTDDAFNDGLQCVHLFGTPIVVLSAYNVLRLCVCLPLAQCFKLPQMLMGQIAQNRCYKLAAVN